MKLTKHTQQDINMFAARLLDCAVFYVPPTQYKLYGRRFLQVKGPNQQYQSTKGTNSTQTNQTYNKQT